MHIFPLAPPRDTRDRTGPRTQTAGVDRRHLTQQQADSEPRSSSCCFELGRECCRRTRVSEDEHAARRHGSARGGTLRCTARLQQRALCAQARHHVDSRWPAPVKRHDACLWPTHGPPVTDPEPYLLALIEHRNERIDSIRELLRTDDRRISDMVPLLYPDIQPALHTAAGLSTLASVQHLERLGEVTTLEDVGRGVVFSYCG